MKLFVCVIFIIILVLGFLCFMSFSNPQLNRWLYIWQANIYPKKLEYAVGYEYMGPIEYCISIPPDFSKVWRDWYKSGCLKRVTDYRQSPAKYFERSYWDKDVLCSEAFSTTKKTIIIRYDAKGDKALILLYDLTRNDLIEIYSKTKNIDLQKNYASDISDFESEFKKWKP